MAFDTPQSRNEALLQNLLGAENEIGDPQSRIEAILTAMLNGAAVGEPYTDPPQSRNEELLMAIKTDGSYSAEAQSRIEKNLKVQAGAHCIHWSAAEPDRGAADPVA